MKPKAKDLIISFLKEQPGWVHDAALARFALSIQVKPATINRECRKLAGLDLIGKDYCDCIGGKKHVVYRYKEPEMLNLNGQPINGNRIITYGIKSES